MYWISLDVFDNIMNMLGKDPSVDMVYLDFAKAFDKVDHGILLHKLKDLGITGKLGVWFFHFLSNRSHFVRLPGGVSNDHPVKYKWGSSRYSPGSTVILNYHI